MVTHDPKAAAYARRVVHLEKGELVNEEGQAQRNLSMGFAK